VRTQVIADAVLCRPDTLRNYKSVEEDLEEANIELDRYATLGYMKRIPLKEAEREFSGGTVSRLGLVLKIKDDGQRKRRIVIDLRRSGGNAKSVLPEKLVLPRLTDGVKLIKEIRKRSTQASDPAGEHEMELALVDVSDAFTVLPVAKAELKHTMAPSTKEGEMLVFQALLFGYKVAPLLYSFCVVIITVAPFTFSAQRRSATKIARASNADGQKLQRRAQFPGCRIGHLPGRAGGGGNQGNPRSRQSQCGSRLPVAAQHLEDYDNAQGVGRSGHRV